MTVRTHFDGRVIVLDEPVDLPINAPLDLDIKPANGGSPTPPTSVRKRVELPLIRGDGKRIINPTSQELDASLWGD
jgi:hypothetical protein